MANDQYRPLRLVEPRRGSIQRERGGRAEHGFQLSCIELGQGVGNFDLRELDILRKVDEDRARTTLARQTESLAEHPRDVLGGRQLEGALGDRPDHADEFSFLERLVTDTRARDWTRQR